VPPDTGLKPCRINMRRHIQPEILDELFADDPRAVQSRRDLQKVNTLMGQHGGARRALSRALRLLVELRCRRRHVLPRVARRPGQQARVRAVLVDRHPRPARQRGRDSKLPADVDTCRSDVFEWLCRPHADQT
jgi:hypothetical protein